MMISFQTQLPRESAPIQFASDRSSSWVAENWFDVLQSVGIIAGILFTAYSLLLSVRTQRVANLLQFTANHREIWSNVLERPELRRILDRNPDVDAADVSLEEQLFVSFVILHMLCAYEAVRARAVIPMEHFEDDVRAFLSRPVPYRVWERVRPVHNQRFANFVDGILSRSSRAGT